jgi:hypothetical protein
MILSYEEARRRRCPLTRKPCMIGDCVKWVFVPGKIKIYKNSWSVNLGYCSLYQNPRR